MNDRDPRKSSPASSIQKAGDRYPYGGVRSTPLKDVDSDIDHSKPKPTLKRRRPRPRAEAPYSEP
ncbi:MAG TPA: hypothetical protein VJR58_20815, partial [Vineibacter sp.]|nr:hypothetical protein [Vineibacter sp.]